MQWVMTRAVEVSSAISTQFERTQG